MESNLESIIKSFKRTLGISVLGLGLTFFNQNANADIDKYPSSSVIVRDEDEKDERAGVYEDKYKIIIAEPGRKHYYEKGELYEGVYRRDTPEGRKMKKFKGTSGLDYYKGPFSPEPDDFTVGILRVNVKDATTKRPISDASVYTESLVYLDFKSANTTNHEGNCMVAVADDDTDWLNPDDFGSEYLGDRTLLRVTASGYKVFETVYEHTYFQMNDGWHNRKFNLEFEDWKFNNGRNMSSIDITVNVYMRRAFIEVR